MNCIFCKIVKGEIPSYKIYENSRILAFLDIAPVNKGHALIIPKDHYENIYDIPENLLKEMISAVKKISMAIKKSVDADGISIAQSNESSAGQVVPHLHFHIMPRFRNDGLKLWPQGSYDEGEMQEYMDKIKREVQ